jgi:hypothetical protein
MRPEGGLIAPFLDREFQDLTELPHELIDPFCRYALIACPTIIASPDFLVESTRAHSSIIASPYPYTTSDNCTTAAFIDDVGLNWKYIERVIMHMKPIILNGSLPNIKNHLRRDIGVQNTMAREEHDNAPMLEDAQVA